jgi:hypothetical protein
VILFSRDALQDLESVTRREWLVTNGIGGFACGTIAGMNTRLRCNGRCWSGSSM